MGPSPDDVGSKTSFLIRLMRSSRSRENPIGPKTAFFRIRMRRDQNCSSALGVHRMRVCSTEGRMGGVDVDVDAVDTVGFTVHGGLGGGSRDGEAMVEAGVPEMCKVGPARGMIHAPREYIESHGRGSVDVDDGRGRRGGVLTERNKLRCIGWLGSSTACADSGCGVGGAGDMI